jgi:hypothetical protein
MRMAPRRTDQDDKVPLTIGEARIVADLRIMHAKVDELLQVVSNLRRRHSDAIIHKYADQALLAEDIQHVDEIYLWFVKLKEQRDRERRKRG